MFSEKVPPGVDRPAASARRGRGAVSNPTGRFERGRLESVDDGWGPDAEELEPPAIKTRVVAERTLRIINRNESPDVGFDRSINPYKGCEHGCVYCFARPTHAFLGWSPGLDFETRIVSKPEAPDRLRRELAKKGYEPATVVLGANTDCYQPVEGRLEITRRLIAILLEHRHPFVILTKSARVLRDLDLLRDAAALGIAKVTLSITTLDGDLARRMEPRASSPARRLEALRRLTEAGVPAGVLAAPMIPALNDHELERIIEASAEAGAVTVGTVLLRLPLELKQLFEEWLHEHAPLRAAAVLARLRAMHRGELYRAKFGTRMKGEGPQAELLQQRLRVAARRHGIPIDKLRNELDASLFRVPPAPGTQLGLFGAPP